MNRLFALLFPILFAGGVCGADTNVLIDKDAAVQVPSTWKDTNKSKEDFDVLLQSPTTQAVFSAVKEDPKVMEIYEMAEYTQATIDQYKDGNNTFKPGEPKAGEVNGLASQFFQAHATISHKDRDYPMKFLIMTIKGKTHFYTLAATISVDGNEAAATKEALAAMKSFRERPGI